MKIMYYTCSLNPGLNIELYIYIYIYIYINKYISINFLLWVSIYRFKISYIYTTNKCLYSKYILDSIITLDHNNNFFKFTFFNVFFLLNFQYQNIYIYIDICYW